LHDVLIIRAITCTALVFMIIFVLVIFVLLAFSVAFTWGVGVTVVAGDTVSVSANKYARV
jgi:hypothetical protein